MKKKKSKKKEEEKNLSLFHLHILLSPTEVLCTTHRCLSFKSCLFLLEYTAAFSMKSAVVCSSPQIATEFPFKRCVPASCQPFHVANQCAH